MGSDPLHSVSNLPMNVSKDSDMVGLAYLWRWNYIVGFVLWPKPDFWNADWYGRVKADPDEYV
jgi:hypothetical protein